MQAPLGTDSLASISGPSFQTLPLDPDLLDLLERARLVKWMQIINGRKPEWSAAALRGEHVGTVVRQDDPS